MCVAQLQLKNVRVFRERWPWNSSRYGPGDQSSCRFTGGMAPSGNGTRNGADHVIRIAAHRPAMSLSDYVLQSTMEYSPGLHGNVLWKGGGLRRRLRLGSSPHLHIALEMCASLDDERLDNELAVDLGRRVQFQRPSRGDLTFYSATDDG